MSTNYPASLDSFVSKSDGPDQKIMASHVNNLQDPVVAIETELGTDPAGSLADLKTRLAVRLNNNGKLKQPQQLVTVGKTNCDFTTYSAARASISDAASDKIYTILVFPGRYNEAIALLNYVNVVAVDPKSTIFLQQVADNNTECHCYLNFTIESSSGYGLFTQHANTVTTLDCDISSSSNTGVYCENGTITINGNVSSSVSYGFQGSGGSLTINGNISSSASPAIYCVGTSLTLNNGNITCTYNNANGHGVDLGSGTLILHSVKITCTHANAKSIYSADARNAYCTSVWANKDDDANITQLIAGGFNFDANVQ